MLFKYFGFKYDFIKNHQILKIIYDYFIVLVMEYEYIIKAYRYDI